MSGVEDYLAHYPAPGEDADVLPDRLSQEYEQRRRREPALTIGAYATRFPHLRESLSTRLKAAPPPHP